MMMMNNSVLDVNLTAALMEHIIRNCPDQITIDNDLLSLVITIAGENNRQLTDERRLSHQC